MGRKSCKSFWDDDDVISVAIVESISFQHPRGNRCCYSSQFLLVMISADNIHHGVKSVSDRNTIHYPDLLMVVVTFEWLSQPLLLVATCMIVLTHFIGNDIKGCHDPYCCYFCRPRHIWLLQFQFWVATPDCFFFFLFELSNMSANSSFLAMFYMQVFLACSSDMPQHPVNYRLSWECIHFLPRLEQKSRSLVGRYKGIASWRVTIFGGLTFFQPNRTDSSVERRCYRWPILWQRDRV